jgi:hypothetical protein
MLPDHDRGIFPHLRQELGPTGTVVSLSWAIRILIGAKSPCIAASGIAG